MSTKRPSDKEFEAKLEASLDSWGDMPAWVVDETRRARASEKRLAEMLRGALDAANERIAPDAWREQMDLVESILSGAVRAPLCKQYGRREVGDERAGWATPVCLECLPLPRRAGAALSGVES